MTRVLLAYWVMSRCVERYGHEPAQDLHSAESKGGHGF